ncbi:thiolase family protein [Micrococcales bacterium 31B]|nr:thiolase family protein [Micrococcales bacterium 31B]
MSDTYIIAGARTPIGRYGGALSAVRPDDLAALVIGEAVKRSGVTPTEIDEVIFGAANQAGEDNRNVARMGTLLAGLPQEIPGFTVNRLCASGMTALATGRQMIAAGDADIVIAGGVESMSRAPWVQEKPTKAFAGPGKSFDTSIGWRFTNPAFGAEITLSMPQTAQEIANRQGLTREELDEFALASHQNALKAIAAGHFADEIVPVVAGKRRDGSEIIVDTDEGPRAETSLEVLAKLRPVTQAGANHPAVITAGNASSLNDGAAALILASAEAVERLGLKPRARIVASANAGLEPAVMGLGPVPATAKALSRAGWAIGDLDAVELNEAFAAQAIGCIRGMGVDPAIVNTSGGAIALGHPLGCSGARIVLTLLGRLERDGGTKGLATMCVGVGQGTAMLIERV